jgi:hypothetical protein
VVPVVVDHGDATGLARAGEAALHALEIAEGAIGPPLSSRPISPAAQTAASEFCTLWRPNMGRTRSAMVRDEPLARISHHHVEHLAARIVAQVHRAHVRLRAEAIGHDAPVGDAADQGLHFRMVDAQRAEAVERHVLDERA